MALSGRAVWQVACALIEEHGAGAAEFTVRQFGDIIKYSAAVEDRRRIAATIDAIASAELGS